MEKENEIYRGILEIIDQEDTGLSLMDYCILADAYYHKQEGLFSLRAFHEEMKKKIDEHPFQALLEAYHKLLEYYQELGMEEVLKLMLRILQMLHQSAATPLEHLQAYLCFEKLEEILFLDYRVLRSQYPKAYEILMLYRDAPITIDSIQLDLGYDYATAQDALMLLQSLGIVEEQGREYFVSKNVRK